MSHRISDRRPGLQATEANSGPHRVQVRVPANDREWAAATGLMLDYFRWLAPMAGVESVVTAQPHAGSEVEDLAAVYRQPSHRFLLAVQGGLAVGIVGLKALESVEGPEPADPPDLRYEAGVVELVRFYCRPAARGSGIGSMLLSEAVSAARAIGFRRVVLDTVPAIMPAAVRLYENYGFEATTDAHALPVTDGVRYRLDL